MGNVLFFDPFNGASGDMILGALVDLGLPLDLLRAELAKLGLEEHRITAEKLERQGLRGVNLKVAVEEVGGHRHHHAAPHRHHHPPARGFSAIRQMIESSGLERRVKDWAVRIFRRLGEAEARVHGCALEEVHFHEVGAVDSIVDIVGACVGFRHFEVERFFSSPLQLGQGVVSFSHGTWPVPAPATAELIRGFPSRLGGAEGELTTPTGAAIITTLADSSAAPPAWTLEKSGFGAGDREYAEIPNMLRLMLGRAAESVSPESLAPVEEIALLEASIDDMDPELLGNFLELALSRGALDVYYGPLYMKKNRPGVLLSLLCRSHDLAPMAELVFRETTTLGLRWTPWRRWVLDRETRRIESPFGPVRVKIARLGGRVVNVWPEFEDLKKISRDAGVPLKELRGRVLAQLEDSYYE